MIDIGETYAPHIMCLLRDPWIVAVHVLSNAMIWGAYFAIPAALWHCTRHRRDLLFRGMVVWFGCFIILCGLTHAGNILEVWHPAYWFTAALKLSTAVVSWITMAQLMPIIPQVLNLPNLTELEQLRQWMLRPQTDRMEEMIHELEKITKVVQLFTPKS